MFLSECPSEAYRLLNVSVDLSYIEMACSLPVVGTLNTAHVTNSLCQASFPGLNIAGHDANLRAGNLLNTPLIRLS